MQPAGPIIAHRGASARYPENTCAALEAAHAAGCSWVEVDAQVTADGRAVLMHDFTLDRTTTGTGPVAMQEFAAIAAAKVRAPQSGAPTDAAPPALEEVLALCDRLGLGLVLEIKACWGVDAADAGVVTGLIPAAPGFELVVTSFSVPCLQAVRGLRPDLALGLACLRPPVDPAATAQALGLAAVHSNAPFTTAADVAAMRAAGLHTAVATVNDPAAARGFLEMGVDGVMTDHPELLG